MNFDDETFTSEEKTVKRFWGRITEMITGPEAEYTYLRRLLNNFGIK